MTDNEARIAMAEREIRELKRAVYIIAVYLAVVSIFTMLNNHRFRKQIKALESISQKAKP